MPAYQNGAIVRVKQTFGVETIPGDFSTFVPTDPTTVTFRLRDPDNTITVYVFGTDPEVTNPDVGVYILEVGPLDLAGVWYWRASGTGAVVANGEGDFTILPSSVTTPVTTEPVNGPCQSWCDPQDIVDCSNVEVGSDTSLLEDVAFEASQLLFQLSGRQFTGRCAPVTVRPCAQGCNCNLWWAPGLSPGAPQFPVGYWGWWGPGSGFGAWGWGWGGSGCGCAPVSKALLPGYPVTSIEEVKIDGVAIDPSEYRLDDYRWLVRMWDSENHPQFWPGCQNLSLPDTEVGTWSCTYMHGVTPPDAGKRAAAQLAGELYKFCLTGECGLPVGTTQVTRTGITVQKAPFLAWAQINGRWATGLPMVDLFLSAYNPAGLKRRPVAWAPGSPQYAKRVGS